jgi:hypothetical protein
MKSVRELDAAFGKELFEVSVGEAVAEVPAHREQNHLRREPEPGEGPRSRPDRAPTDRSAALARAIVELLPGARHDTTHYANNTIESDHRRLKARLRPMRGLKRDRTAAVVIRGHAFIQNLRRGHYELGADRRHDQFRVAAAFDELAATI